MATGNRRKDLLDLLLAASSANPKRTATFKVEKL